MGYLFGYALICFISTYIFSWLLLRFCRIKAFLDIPDDDRKMHKMPVPRYGGIPFVVTLTAVVLFLFQFSSEYLWFYLSLTVIGLLGFIDDLITLSWRTKLLVQFFVGSYIFYLISLVVPTMQFFLFQFHLPVYLMYGVFMLWFFGILNAVNLVDGMDGLAGGMVFVMFIGFSFLGWITGNLLFLTFSVMVMACLYAFLVFNARPAKFFMGDMGSLFLGFLLAVAPILFFFTSKSQAVLDITPFLVFCSYLILDTFRVFYHRVKQKKNPLKPDRSHFHHQLLDKTGSYNATLFYIYFFIALFILFGMVLLQLRYTTFLSIGYLIFLVLFIVSTRFSGKIIDGLRGLLSYFKTMILKINYLNYQFSTKFLKRVFALYFLVTVSMWLILNSLYDQLVFMIVFLGFITGVQVFFKKNLFFAEGITAVYGYLFLNSLIMDTWYSNGWIIGFGIVKYLLLGVLLNVLGRYLLNNSLLYLFRFWKNSDLLFLVCGLLAFGYITILQWSSLLYLCVLAEVVIVFLCCRAMVHRYPKPELNIVN